ncbi:TIGR02206 family membrane protein [Paenibacillus sp. MMS20-IR301]|uniref:YwaF family protein n=1 Tax=Paenibacillus sp. MMS20-IR301 TaxID=2895946 RepID=UPI0028EF624F|nr:TIGR02206 family membrane protein [Paenibacillus sp. MMS20-IR301]WNS44433.1 TIGR02206 family membrane protein [Paenibacillus sp. MMS20-IR301]
MNRIHFWDRQRDIDFVMFSTPHLIALAVIAVCCLILYAVRFSLRQHTGPRLFVRLLLILLLISAEAGLHVWYLSHDIWSRSSSLPLELCGITLLLSALMLLTRSRLLYSFLYFAGIGGAFIALLTPNLVYPFPHFRFLLFFIAHGSIILASLYMTWVEQYRPGWRSLFFTMLCLNIVAACVYAADLLLDSNYMFLVHKPSTFSVLDYFGPYPYYLLVEEGFAFIIFLLMFLIFFKLPELYAARHSRRSRTKLRIR